MYQNAKYYNLDGQLNGIIVVINGLQSYVPISMENADYKMMMKLVEENKLIIEPADE